MIAPQTKAYVHTSENAFQGAWNCKDTLKISFLEGAFSKGKSHYYLILTVNNVVLKSSTNTNVEQPSEAWKTIWFFRKLGPMPSMI